MSSFLASTFAVLALKPETICAVLGTSRKIMNCSAIPVIFSSETWDLLCPQGQPEKNEQKLLEFFSTFSDTMQFTEKLRIQNDLQKNFIKGVLENLMKKRYFTRTIRLLQLPSVDPLIEACSSLPSSTAPMLLSNLRSLSIEGCFVRGTLESEQVKTLCSLCPLLETLNIPGQGRLTDEGLEFLSKLKYLKTLDLCYCERITDSGLQHLVKLPSLRSLNLSICDKITDSGLEHLASMPSLQTLSLRSCCKITDIGLQHLASLLSLQTLNLALCNKITDSGLQHLAGVLHLVTLHLDHCNKITDSGLEYLATLTPSLQSLSLEYCQLITDSGLSYLAQLSSLRSLNLFCCNKITDSGIEQLAKLSCLQSLYLYGCNRITDKGCRVFSKSTKVLR